MREYIPDNLDRFVVHETETERLKRLRDRLEDEWGELCDKELDIEDGEEEEE